MRTIQGVVCWALAIASLFLFVMALGLLGTPVANKLEPGYALWPEHWLRDGLTFLAISAAAFA